MVRPVVGPALLVAALGLSGCNVGPDYELPKQAVANASAARGALIKAPNVDPQGPPDAWWRLFRAPVLDGLIREALAANTDLRAAEANLERSKALLDQTDALREPSVAVNFDSAYNQRSAEAYVHPGEIPAAQLYDTGLGVSYDLDLFGRLRRMSEAAGDEAEVAAAARDLVKINVAANMARAYAELCNVGEQLDAERRVVALQDRVAALTRQSALAGRRDRIEIEQQEAASAATHALLPSLEARRRNALFRIATLAGRPPGASDPGLLACARTLELDAPLPVGDGAGLLARRPDVRAAERRLAASTARIGVATADLYPAVRLGASIGSTGAVTDILIDRTNRYAAGPGISWQINQSIPRARIAQAEAQTRADLAEFDGVVLSALRETDSAINQFAQDEARLVKLEVARSRAGRAATDAGALRAAGRMDTLSALAAERAQADDDAAVAVAKGQVNLDQIALFLALGGGWREVAAVARVSGPDAR